MLKCFTPCVYYYEKDGKIPTCDIYDGKDVRKIPEKEIENCKHFKIYKDIKKMLTF